MILIDNLTKKYRSDEIETLAVRNVSLEVKTGDFLAIMGPSGSGKSTLLSLIGLLDRPSSGSYLLMGEETSQQKEGRLAQLRREHIGFVFQSFNLIDELTVAENVELGLVYRKMSSQDRRDRIASAMDQVGIGH